jgi:hypothetical protein
MQFLVGEKSIDFRFTRSSTIYNITEDRIWCRLYSDGKRVLKVNAEHFETNNVTEVYKIRDFVNGKWYPWVSYGLDFKTPLDFYVFIYGGHLKNNTQINNSIYKGKPVNHIAATGTLEGLSNVPRTVPVLPRVVYDRAPCEIDNIFLWSNKPYGLCVDFTEQPMPEIVRPL